MTEMKILDRVEKIGKNGLNIGNRNPPICIYGIRRKKNSNINFLKIKTNSSLVNMVSKTSFNISVEQYLQLSTSLTEIRTIADIN